MQNKHSLFAVLGAVLLAGLVWIAVGGNADSAGPLVSWTGSDGELLTDAETPPAEMQGQGDRVEVVTPDGELIAEELEDEDEERPLISVHGRVVDTFARPVVGAKVVLEIGRASRGRRGFPSRSRVGTPVITGEDGRFAFEGPGFTESSVSLLVTHVSHAPHMTDHSLEIGGTELDVGDVQVPSGGVVIGTVADGDGVGIAGATAQLLPQRENRLRWVRDRDELLPPVQTDGNGFFRIDHVAAGDYRIEAAAPLYQRETTNPITISEGEEEHLEPIRLGPGQRVTGVVLSPEGTPVAEAEVWVFASRGSDSRQETDDRGRFSFDHLRAGTSSVRVTAKGFVTYHREGIDTNAIKDLTIQLERGLGVTGVVRDQRTGNPVLRYAARIRRIGSLPDRSENVEERIGIEIAAIRALGQRMGRGDPRAEREMERRWRSLGGMRGGADGGRGRGGGSERFRSSFRGDGGESIGEVVDRREGRFSFAGMDEGVYEIDIDSPDHQRLSSERIELRSGATAPYLVLTAQSGLLVSGTVLSSADGDPVDGARVDLMEVEDESQREGNDGRPPSPMRMLFRGGSRRGPPILSTETDKAGRFTLRHAPAGRYAVLARADGFAERTSTEFELRRDADGISLDLGALSRISGIVLGVPPGREAETRVLAFAGPGQMSDVGIQADGSYLLEDLQPGSYVVRAFVGSMRNFIRHEMRNIFGQGGGQLEFDLVLAEGDEQTFNPVLSLQPVGEVVGSIMVDGRPGQGLRVNLRSADSSQEQSGGGRGGFRFGGRERGSARTNQDGEFTIREVEEGEYLLIIQSAEQRNELYRGRVSVLRDVRNEQRLSLQTVVFKGEVTALDAETDELSGSLRLYLGVQEEPEDRREFASSGRYYSIRVRDGQFEETELAPGDYLLVVRMSGRQQVEQQISLMPGMGFQRLVAGALR